jgi:hypothetical protein
LNHFPRILYALTNEDIHAPRPAGGRGLSDRAIRVGWSIGIGIEPCSPGQRRTTALMQASVGAQVVQRRLSAQLRRPIHVDSGPANTGHSPKASRTGQIDPKPDEKRDFAEDPLGAIAVIARQPAERVNSTRSGLSIQMSAGTTHSRQIRLSLGSHRATAPVPVSPILSRTANRCKPAAAGRRLVLNSTHPFLDDPTVIRS